MTAQDWLDLLPLVADRGWTNGGGTFVGAIRDRDDRCPVCSLVHELSGGSIDMKDRWWIAVLSLIDGAIAESAGPVARAADLPYHPIRPALMAALGMTP